MAAKCGYAGKEIVKKDYGVSKEIGKKCEDINKIKAWNYDYVGKKFGFSRVLWMIKNYCITPPLNGKTFCSPEFYVKGFRLTRWEMSLERVWNAGDGSYNVFFLLKRLECEQFIGNAVADCIVEYSGRDGVTYDIDFKETFGVYTSVKEEVKYAAITPTVDYHIPEFKLKLQILVYFDDLNETIPHCENLGIRRLSEDLRGLYVQGVVPDLSLLHGERQLKVHKAILYTRIKNLNFKNKISSSSGAIDLEEFDAEDVEKVIKFLYTGNLIYTVVSDPSIAVYRFAEYLEVKPIIAYYNPDEITFTSDTDVEEFSATWTIEDFSSRDDLLQSPVTTNKMMDTKWQIKVNPKGFQNEGVYLDIFFFYELTVSKNICLELFLQGGPKELISYRFHQKINGEGNMRTNNFIKLDEVANYIRDDSLTIGLKLRMSTGQDNPSVCSESKSDHIYLSEQKYYDHLSNDILWLRIHETFSDLRRLLTNQNIILDVHECILRARCASLSDALKKHVERFHNISNVVISEILYFMYSGKLDERSLLQDTFHLYIAAVHFEYQHLKEIIVEKLANILSVLNARAIRDFALEQRIHYLVDSAARFLE